MTAEKIVSSIDNIFQWISRMAYLNLLGMGFTLFGLIVFGAFPSIVASICVSRQLIKKGFHEAAVFKIFKKYYIKEFVSSNILGYILLIIGLVLFVNFKLLSNSNGAYPILVTFFFYLLIIFYVIIVIWSFPLLAVFDNKIFNHLKNALIIGISKIHYSIIITVSIIAVVYVSVLFPGIIPFFTFSVSFTIWYWLAHKVFNQLQLSEGNYR